MSRLFRVCGTCGSLVATDMMGQHMENLHGVEPKTEGYRTPITLYFGTQIFKLQYLQNEECAAAREEAGI